MQKSLVGTGKRIYGRIQDTGANYVIRRMEHEPRVGAYPCRRLIDAQMLLAKVMRKSTFDVLRLHNKNFIKSLSFYLFHFVYIL